MKQFIVGAGLVLCAIAVIPLTIPAIIAVTVLFVIYMIWCFITADEIKINVEEDLK